MKRCLNCMEEFEDHLRICPACGAASPKGNRFCIHCGAKFNETETQTEHQEG